MTNNQQMDAGQLKLIIKRNALARIQQNKTKRVNSKAEPLIDLLLTVLNYQQ